MRPEFRTNWKFGRPYYLDGAIIDEKSNSFFVQQWVRLGFNYSISPDVTFFFQPQYSKNWGVNNTVDANGTGGTLFARQAFMLVRNFLVPNLTVKAGRQLVVWGNHRMFGHFDWNNVGWSHDGLTAEFKLSNTAHPGGGLVANGGEKLYGSDHRQLYWRHTGSWSQCHPPMPTSSTSGRP